MRAAPRLAGLLVALPFLGGPAHTQVPADGNQLFTVAEQRVVESSGLVELSSGFATVNDAGNSGEVFLLDAKTGETIGITRWRARPKDVEAIAPIGHRQVWIGDIGDNRRERSHVSFAKVTIRPGYRATPTDPMRAQYPDGPHDAETLLRNPLTGHLFVVTKGDSNGSVFAVPRLQAGGTVTLTQVADNVIALPTDGAFFPDGRHVVLRNYDIAVVYTFPGWEEVGRFPLPDQKQGEGLAMARDGKSIYLSSEGVRQPVWRTSIPPWIVKLLQEQAEPTRATDPAGVVTVPGASPVTDDPVAARDVHAESPSDDTAGLSWPWIVGGLALVGALGLSYGRVRTRRR